MVSCVYIMFKYVTESYVSWTCGKRISVVNEEIFETGNDGLRKMVILDGGMKKFPEVFWYLGRNRIRCVSRYRSGIRIGLNDWSCYLLANLRVLWSTLSGGCVDWKKTRVVEVEYRLRGLYPILRDTDP